MQIYNIISLYLFVFITIVVVNVVVVSIIIMINLLLKGLEQMVVKAIHVGDNGKHGAMITQFK